MERLTEQCWRNLDPWECCGQDNFCKRGCHDLGGCTNGCIVPKLYARLAAYEDTGLEPEEYKKHADAIKKLDIEHMHDLLQAEKDGRMVVLPCKVGDTVWTNFAVSGWYFRGKNKPYSARVVFIGLNDSDAMGGGLINVVYVKHDYMAQFSLLDIGKTVFLTREEAEAALKNMEEA